MSINWDKVEEENKSEYKDYAPEGNYKVKVKEAELKYSSRANTPGIQFTFEDTEEYSMPRFGVTHWLTFKEDKAGWRQHHFKELFVLFGIEEDNARKTVEMCEGKGDQEKIVKAYEAAFKKAVAKADAVDLVVYKRTPDAMYNECDFASGKVRLGRPEKPGKAESVGSILDEGEEADDLDSLPF